MIKGIEFTSEMNEALVKYQQDNFLTMSEVMRRCDLNESTIYIFRRRKKIGLGSLKKIKDNIGLDLL